MRYAFVSLVMLFLAPVTLAADWLTLPSTFSHNGAGVRVAQFAPIDAPEAPSVPNFLTSGYTHTRSSLNYGQSADNYHRVETWGDPVRPYGEWRFPYRPYSTPYPNWGAPFAGFNLGLGYYGPGDFGPQFQGPGYGGPGYGGPGHGGPGHGGDGHGGPGHGGDGNGGQPPESPQMMDPAGDGRRYLPRGDDRRGFLNRGASPFDPYPAGQGSPYPVAPYYDGYYPPYSE